MKKCLGGKVMGKWRDMPFTWCLGLLTLLFSIAFFTNDDIAMGITLLAVTIGLFALGCYFIVREGRPDEARQQKEQCFSNEGKTAPTAETSDKYTYSTVTSNSTVDLSLEDYREKYIIKALDVSQKIMYALHLHEDFLNITDEIISTINNDLLMYESLFGKRLYCGTCFYFQVSCKTSSYSKS